MAHLSLRIDAPWQGADGAGDRYATVRTLCYTILDEHVLEKTGDRSLIYIDRHSSNGRVRLSGNRAISFRNPEFVLWFFTPDRVALGRKVVRN
jgi:hypothetical protein